jgi:hypothetical protein
VLFKGSKCGLSPNAARKCQERIIGQRKNGGLGSIRASPFLVSDKQHQNETLSEMLLVELHERVSINPGAMHIQEMWCPVIPF